MDLNQKEKIGKRVDRVRRKFEQRQEIKQINKIVIPQSIVSAFSELKNQLQQIEINSRQIANKMRHKRERLDDINKSDKQTDVTGPLTLSTTNAKDKKSFQFQKAIYDLQQVQNFQKPDSKFTKAQKFFNKLPFTASYLHKVDVSLKPENVCQMPFPVQNKAKQLKDLLVRHDDTHSKNLLQYNIYHLQIRQHIELISKDLLKFNNINSDIQQYQLIQGLNICITSTDQYQYLLSKYKVLSKYFFQNKFTVSQQLKLGQLQTHQKKSFKNLMDCFKQIIKLCQAIMDTPGLEFIYIYISNVLESKLQQLMVNIQIMHLHSSLSQQIFKRVLKIKNDLIYKKITAQNTQIQRRIPQFIMGYSKQQLLRLINNASKIIIYYKQIFKKSDLKAKFINMIQGC